jgi:hypothetical protein
MMPICHIESKASKAPKTWLEQQKPSTPVDHASVSHESGNAVLKDRQLHWPPDWRKHSDRKIGRTLQPTQAVFCTTSSRLTQHVVHLPKQIFWELATR